MKSIVRINPLVLYFTIAFAYSWSVWLIAAQYASSLEAMAPALMLGSFGPFLGGLVVSALHGGGAAVKRYLLQIVKWRVPFWCYLAAWFVFPGVLALGLFASGMLRTNESLLPALASVILAMPINALLSGFLEPGPLGEEPGWRGFALPNLLKLGEWPATIVLGLVWAFWHLPLALRFRDFYETLPGVTLPMWLVMYPLSVIALSVILTKLWKWTGSVLIAVFFHGAVNFTMARLIGGLLAPAYNPVVMFGIVVALFWVVAAVFVGIDSWLVRDGQSARSATTQAETT